MDNIRILIGNFNSEELWANGDEATIPKPDLLGVKSVIAKMDELFIYLARKQDIVILREKPSTEFLDYLKELQIVLPKIYVVKNGSSPKQIGELLLEDRKLIEELQNKVMVYKITGGEVEVVPYCITVHEERFAALIGGKISSSSILPRLYNNKEYARELLMKYGIEQPIGTICMDIEEFRLVSHDMLHRYGKIIIKEIYGSGGSNLYIVQSDNELSKLCKLYDREENRQKKILVEKYYETVESYNYQYLIRTGSFIPYSFSRQILLNGKIMGSFFAPVDVSKNELKKRHFSLASPIVEHIANSGYQGIVGFDGILCDDGKLFPIVDINCRINLSTIFHVIHSTYFNTNYAQFYCIELKMKGRMDFSDIIKEYIADPYNMKKKEGMVVLNTNSLFSNIKNGMIRLGRMYIGMFYNDRSNLVDNYNKLLKKLDN